MVVLVLAVLLGLMFAFFTVLNLFADLPSNPFGSFGVRFIYEMDEVMGGLLGVPHYSKVEAVLLAVGCAGAWIAVFTDGLLVPCLGFICGAAYMLICGFYGYFAGTGAAPFLVFAAINGICLGGKVTEILELAADSDEPRFGSSGSARGDLQIVEIFGAAMACCVVLSAGVMKARNTDERAKFNQRFVRIAAWCDANSGFVWLPGKGAPEGFDDKTLIE